MRPLYLFYLLVIYVLIQFCWWTFLLVQLNNEVYEHRIENVHLVISDPVKAMQEEALLESKLHQRWWMIIGEGTVFIILLGLGGGITYKSFKKEFDLARQQKNFLLSVTHEFKSPLASIKLYLQTLQRHDLDKEKVASFIESAIRDSDRLDALVENALLANMIDHKGYKFSREEINISALARLLIQKFNASPEIRSPAEFNIEENLIVHGDKQALSLMIMNLLENALKYSAAAPGISLTLKKSGNRIILSVADQGQGIAPAEKENIFKKFYRIGNEETRSTKGTGLGLFLVKQIADYHKGRISVQDNKPKGSIFTVDFPA
jgi:two-component system phosphate regulon sensor histidine kinase PhoR